MKQQISGTEQSKEDPRASPEKNPDPPVAAVALFRQLSPDLLDAAGRGRAGGINILFLAVELPKPLPLDQQKGGGD